jgi:hypothetical protein
MNQKAAQLVMFGVGVVILAKILESRPDCNRGCKTVLEHITQHVLTDIASSLLGA